MNCVFIFVATLDFFLLPAVTYAAKYTSPCTDWLVLFRFGVNVRCKSWSYKHPHRIARVCGLLLYIPYLGAEYIVISRLKQYLRYVFKAY